MPTGALPWERNADHELIDYELGQYARSQLANLRALGLM
jgi:hypothetical protein